jgi:hypothetical protein
MNTSLKGLLAVVAVALPGVAFAQSSDAQYCAALVGKYEQYLDMSSKRGEQPQSLEARTGVEPAVAISNARCILDQGRQLRRGNLVDRPDDVCRHSLHGRTHLREFCGCVSLRLDDRKFLPNEVGEVSAS